jgi:hypothetical protein
LGGFLGIGGSSAKTDRKTELKGFGQLDNVFNFALPSAKSSFGKGQESLGKAGDYWSKLLSGNRPAMEQAVAPETNAVRAGADASKRNLDASGTARGGGVSAVNQQRETDTMAKIDNLLFGVRPEAAKETAKIGAAELATASNMLGMAENTAGTTTEEARLSRVDSQKINQAIVKQWTQAIEAAMMAFA